MNAPPLIALNDLKRACPLDRDALEAVRTAFVKHARGEVRQPPVLSLDLPEVRGEVDVKTAWTKGMDAFCVKLSTGFFGNPDIGLPSASGMMIVLNARTGRPRAVLADDGYLTELRTAAAGALAADALARPDASVLAVLGAGAQARWQARAVAMVRELSQVLVWARNEERGREVAAAIAAELGVAARWVVDASEAVAAADVVVTTTPAQAALFGASAVRRGTHVTAMGSDGAGKRELPEALLRSADRLVADDAAQSRTLGELQGLSDVPDPVLLGAVLDGTVPGREAPEQVTVCDLTGMGVQDTAIAVHALARLPESD